MTRLALRRCGSLRRAFRRMANHHPGQMSALAQQVKHGVVALTLGPIEGPAYLAYLRETNAFRFAECGPHPTFGDLPG